MQAHHYTLAFAALWLATLALLPLLLSRATARAKADGHAAGTRERDLHYADRIEALNADLLRLGQQRVDEQTRFNRSMIQRQKTINELEERVMSHTGLAVTVTDLQHVRSASETLALAFKTWSSLPGTEPWRSRATTQAAGLNALATRIGSELRMAPAIASTTPTARRA